MAKLPFLKEQRLQLYYNIDKKQGENCAAVEPKYRGLTSFLLLFHALQHPIGDVMLEWHHETEGCKNYGGLCAR